MVNYYKKSLLDCLNLLHNARRNPSKNPLKWKNLQKKLLDRHFYLEKRILECKQEIKNINQLRKNPKERLTKEQSINIKNHLDYLDYQIEEYHWVKKCFKSIGDGIAFTFISRYDIKPQTFKEDAGFISGKVGFRQEKSFFNKAFKFGFICIFHDLTSVLRFRDLTIIDKDGYVPIEVKTSSIRNKRVIRQEENADKLYEYLENDTTENLFGMDKMFRVSHISQEKDHIRKFNKLIEQSNKLGFSHSFVEKGLLYIVGHAEEGFETYVNDLLKRAKFKIPHIHFLNSMKYEQLGYYPFSLSITNPNEYLKFLEGKIMIVIIQDDQQIKNIAEQFGYDMRAADQFAGLKFLPKDSDSKITKFSVSSHYLNRIGMEFLSLSWIFEEMFTRLNNSPKLIDDPSNNKSPEK